MLRNPPSLRGCDVRVTRAVQWPCPAWCPADVRYGYFARSCCIYRYRSTPMLRMWSRSSRVRRPHCGDSTTCVGLLVSETGRSKSTIAPLPTVQNAAARLAMNLDPLDHVTSAVRHLHWLPVCTYCVSTCVKCKPLAWRPQVQLCKISFGSLGAMIVSS